MVEISNPEIVAAAKPGVFVYTFGCQMNEYDSLKLLKILEESYQPVPNVEAAELVLLNTCSVRDKPEQKVYSLLGRLRDLKASGQRMLVGVGGCVAQQEGQNIIQRSKVVDFVFGTHNLSMVPSLVNLRKRGFPPQVAVDYRDEWESLPIGFSEGTRVVAPITISRGCNKNCTYCIVPVTRGREVSRSVDEIEREVKFAVQRGAREVLLLGQTVNSYGLDLKPRILFVELLERVSQIAGVERIRFTSPHPQEIRQDFIDALANNSKICRHVHMPLQSGSDRILKAMNRNYRRERYLKIISALKERVPEIAITTDIIVGFPGELEEDFKQTMDVFEKVQFDGSFSFVFSPRPGTKAATLDDPVPYEQKLAWLHSLQARQEEISRERLAGWVGKRVEVLLEGPSSNDSSAFQGRTSQNVVVNFTAEGESIKDGQLLEVEITRAARFTLLGKLLSLRR